MQRYKGKSFIIGNFYYLIKNLDIKELDKKKLWAPIVLLILCISITIVITFSLKYHVEKTAKKDFEFTCHEIRNKISARLKSQAELLRGQAAWFNFVPHMNRTIWKNIYESQLIEKNLPGILGVGFATIIKPEDLSEHIKSVRAEGFPNYTVHPGGIRNFYTSIIYLEPFGGRNLRAFGYDMFSDSTRREAMIYSRDNNSATLTKKILLVQETDKDIQAGTIMYVPVYKIGMPLKTIAQKREAIIGWVYSPYRMGDLLHGILGNYETINQKNLVIKIYNDSADIDKSVLYESKIIKKDTIQAIQLFKYNDKITFNNNQWYLSFIQYSKSTSDTNYALVYFVAISGFSLSILLFFLFISLIISNDKGIQLEALTNSLKESEEKYKTIFDNDIYAIFIFDLTTLQIIDANDRFCKLYKYSFENIHNGVHISKIFIENECYKLIEENEKSSAIYIPLQTHKKSNGEELPVQIVGGVYSLQNRKVMSILSQDITTRIKTEEEINLINSKLRESISTKDKFFSIIAHDLRSPFQGFLGSTKLMSESISLFNKNELATLSGELYNSSANLYKLLDNLLTWASMQNGSIQFEPKVHKLFPIVESVIEVLKNQIINKELVVNNSVPNYISLLADEKMIGTILRNLITNSIKFTKPNGTISIFSKYIENNFVLIEITDTGIGMNKELMDNLFKIDKKVGRKGTNGEASTGLGLLLCKEFIEKHSGQIWVESEVDKGTKFIFTLPKA